MLMTSDWCLEQRRGDTSEALFAGYNGDENAHVFGPLATLPVICTIFHLDFGSPGYLSKDLFLQQCVDSLLT